MSRLMSVSHTTDAVRERRKTVTRRLGWTFLKPGDRLTLCRKVMGRKPGEPLERIAEVEVVSVRRVPLLLGMAPHEVRLEAVPGHEGDLPLPWCLWFGETFGIKITDLVTRIEWRYL